MSTITSICIEVRTASGQVVQLQCTPDQAASLTQLFEEHVHSVHIPDNKAMAVTHGGYCMYSRFNITQHEYAGGGPDECGGGGYIEVLEINNPPDNRCGIILHNYTTYAGHSFSEWDSVEDAKRAYGHCLSYEHTDGNIRTLQGFRRFVPCKALTPWFFAVGSETIITDYAFPYDLQDDPVFRIGRPCLVHEQDGASSIKICMGTRFMSEPGIQSATPRKYRMVYWADGTIWDELEHRSHSSHGRLRRPAPRPIESSETWICEAMEKFRRLLDGTLATYTIEFVGGNAVEVKLIRSRKRLQSPTTDGRYFCKVDLKGNPNPTTQKGWVNFTPSPAHPDLFTYVITRVKQNGGQVSSIAVVTGPDERKRQWSGVFHVRDIPAPETST